MVNESAVESTKTFTSAVGPDCDDHRCHDGGDRRPPGRRGGGGNVLCAQFLYGGQQRTSALRKLDHDFRTLEPIRRISLAARPATVLRTRMPRRPPSRSTAAAATPTSPSMCSILPVVAVSSTSNQERR